MGSEQQMVSNIRERNFRQQMRQELAIGLIEWETEKWCNEQSHFKSSKPL